MTYAVVWRMEAVHQIGRIEANAVDPARVRQATARMEFALRRYPYDMGESRMPGFRLWYEDVVGLYYWVDDVALRVEILYAAPTRRR